MKSSIKFLALVFVLLTLFSCSSDDDDNNNSNNTNQNPLLGKWEAISGSLVDGLRPSYLIFNNDNSVTLLVERGLGFKNSFETNYDLSEFEIAINLQGNLTYQYTVEGENLTLSDGGSNTSQYQKNNDAPTAGEWVQELTVLSQADAPWDGIVDIAFTYDKAQILYGMNATASYIPLINPETLEEVGQIESTSEARIVEVDKYEDEPYRYQSSGDSDLITYYSTLTGTEEGTIEIADEISGMASVNGFQIWIASNDTQGLYLYDINTGLENEIELGLSTYGLDYQNGYLYVSDGINLHKCETSPEFQVVASYSISDTDLFGVAFDGTHFWVSGYDSNLNSFQLIKTNLTL